EQQENDVCHVTIVAWWGALGRPRLLIRTYGVRVPPIDQRFRLGKRTFEPGELAVMAIVNRTPDSFFDRGATFAEDAALAAIDRAVADGAEIIDIGGVKAGPGAVVDTAEEIRRTVPTVAAVRERFPDVVISIDTWRAEVAREAVAAGADLLNDTWGG